MPLHRLFASLRALALALGLAACGGSAAPGDAAVPTPPPPDVGGPIPHDAASTEADGPVPPDASMTSPPPVVDAARPVSEPPPAAPDDLPPCVRTVPVTDSAGLATALGSARGGDCINLADGNYTFPVITARGTEAAPIVIGAVDVLKATVTSGDLTLDGAAHLVVRGLSWTGSGIITLKDADHVRITRFRIQRMEAGPNQALHDLAAITVAGKSSDCRIDHNDLGPQSQRGNMILATGDENAGTLSLRNRIDHNFFHDVHYTGGNGWETIRSGADVLSFVSSFNVIEHNLFKNDANDPEVISLKSSDNIVRYNTLRASRGQFVLRSGNRDTVHGNYILADGEAQSLGLRVHGGQHKIFNNYIEGVSGPGIYLEGGENNDSNGTLQDHKQVYKTEVVFNTLVNSGGIVLGGAHPMDPVDCTVAYNIVQGGSGLYTQTASSTNIKYLGNIASAAAGVKTGVMVVDPKLVKMGEVFTIGAGSPAIDGAMPTFTYVMDDVTGRARTGTPDIGANELSTDAPKFGPLTEADVGPLAP
jgi:hypothetical protein